MIERDGPTGAWRLAVDLSIDPGTGVHRPGCGVSYAPAPLFDSAYLHSFARLRIVLRHAESPYLIAASEGISKELSGAETATFDTFQSNAAPWHFGAPSKSPRPAQPLPLQFALQPGRLGRFASTEARAATS